MKWFKIISIVFTWLAVGAVTWLSVGFSMDQRENGLCTGLTINIHQPDNQILLLTEDLNAILDNLRPRWDSVPMKEINIQLLEDQLRTHPLALDVSVFSTWKGELHIDMTQNVAFARVQQGNSGHYIDQDGRKFPLSSHASLDLPLISGRTDSASCLSAIALIDQAASHPAFPGGLAQVNIASDGSLQVMPQWHGHVIQWGQSDNFHNKAHKAQALYAYLLQQGQMDSLNRVDLRYSNQVIHTFNPSPSS